jgi:hypothetical protein
MGLISESQLNKFKSAINATTDTFMKKPVVYKRYTTSLDRFNENRRQDQSVELFQLETLIVWGSEKYSMNKEGNGSSDMTNGYALFNIKDLRAAGMIDEEGNFVTRIGSDYLVDQGVEHSVVGYNLVGQLIDENLLVRVFIKKQLRDG